MDFPRKLAYPADVCALQLKPTIESITQSHLRVKMNPKDTQRLLKGASLILQEVLRLQAGLISRSPA